MSKFKVGDKVKLPDGKIGTIAKIISFGGVTDNIIEVPGMSTTSRRDDELTPANAAPVSTNAVVQNALAWKAGEAVANARNWRGVSVKEAVGKSGRKWKVGDIAPAGIGGFKIAEIRLDDDGSVWLHDGRTVTSGNPYIEEGLANNAAAGEGVARNAVAANAAVDISEIKKLADEWCELVPKCAKMKRRLAAISRILTFALGYSPDSFDFRQSDPKTHAELRKLVAKVRGDASYIHSSSSDFSVV